MSTKLEERGIVQTGLQFAIGGTALAFDKAVEMVRGARTRFEDAAERTAEKLDEKMPSTPDTRPYPERTVSELRELAAERDIEGRSTMSKDELVAELRS